MMEKGTDLQEFINGLLDYIRDLLLLKVGVKIQTISLAQENLMTSLAKEFSEQDILYLISLLIKAKNDIKISTNPILVAEMSFVKIAKLQDMHALPEILQQIQSGITVTQPTSQPRTPAANHRQTTRIKQEIKQEATAKPPSSASSRLKYISNIGHKLWKNCALKNPYWQIILITALCKNPK